MAKKVIFKSKLIKIWKITEKVLLIIFAILFALTILQSILAAIFMIISMNNGYLSPWMLKIIEIEKQALRMWANS